MSQSRFLAIGKDPAIIPGVDHHCDESCDYCLVTVAAKPRRRDLLSHTAASAASG